MSENSGTEALNSELGLHKKEIGNVLARVELLLSVVAVVTQALLLQVW